MYTGEHDRATLARKRPCRLGTCLSTRPTRSSLVVFYSSFHPSYLNYARSNLYQTPINISFRDSFVRDRLQLFFNAFEKDKDKHHTLEPKATFNETVGSIYSLLERIPNDTATMEHCGSDQCDFTAVPWGLGAFASHGTSKDGFPPPTSAQRIQWFADAKASLSTRPRLKAYIYFDSLDSEVPFNHSEPGVDAAFRAYLGADQFSVNDGGLVSDST